jgi:hypothetical protein
VETSLTNQYALRMRNGMVRKVALGLMTAGTIWAQESFATCKVHVPVHEYLHSSGYSIYFDFSSILVKKGYEEVDDPALADQVLKLEGNEIEGRVHRAEARFVIGEIEVVQRRWCFTQYCAISDYASAFRKAYKRLDRELPVCVTGRD